MWSCSKLRAGRKSPATANSRWSYRTAQTGMIRIVGHPVLDAAGDIVEFVGTTIDVTEQRQARAALEKALAEIKKSEDQLRTIIDTIPTLAWCTLPDGSAEFLNQRWLDDTGLSAEGGTELGLDGRASSPKTRRT